MENDGGYELVKLEDFDGELEEPWQDAHGRAVLDKNMDEVGTVEDLYVLEDVAAVHILNVAGEDRNFLIPSDAIAMVDEDAVTVEQSKEVILESPEFDTDEVPDLETRRAIYGYYGYPDEFVFETE